MLSLLGASITFTAGCTLRTGTVSLTVQNFSSTDTQFDIRLLRDGSEVYSTTLMVPAGGKRHQDAVVDGGSYELALSADSFGEATGPISMNDCEEQEVSIAVLPEGEIHIQLKQC